MSEMTETLPPDTEELTPVDRLRTLAPSDLAETINLAEMFIRSGLFADSKSVSQGVVKILAGREYGFGPFASMRGLYIVKGKVGMEANLMAQAIKRSARYDYKVREITAQHCTIEFFENGASVGFSDFSIEDAKKAGTQNINAYPRNMLFARALSNGQRWYCPDVFGATAYVRDEMDDAPVDVDVETIDLTPRRKSEAEA